MFNLPRWLANRPMLATAFTLLIIGYVSVFVAAYVAPTYVSLWATIAAVTCVLWVITLVVAVEIRYNERNNIE